MDTVRATGGRVLTKHGEQTRTALLDALKRLLVTRGYRGLKVTDIAHMVHVSPATFYSYFRDVDEAIAIVENSPETCAQVYTYWSRPTAVAAVRWDGGNLEALGALTGGAFTLLDPGGTARVEDPEASGALHRPGGAVLPVRPGSWVVSLGAERFEVMAEDEFRGLYALHGGAG